VSFFRLEDYREFQQNPEVSTLFSRPDCPELKPILDWLGVMMQVLTKKKNA
jgi:hypothetical protein